eukprot:4067559-Karenia_brevis.AAC.1
MAARRAAERYPKDHPPCWSWTALRIKRQGLEAMNSKAATATKHQVYMQAECTNCSKKSIAVAPGSTCVQ